MLSLEQAIDNEKVSWTERRPVLLDYFKPGVGFKIIEYKPYELYMFKCNSDGRLERKGHLKQFVDDLDMGIYQLDNALYVLGVDPETDQWFGAVLQVILNYIQEGKISIEPT